MVRSWPGWKQVYTLLTNTQDHYSIYVNFTLFSVYMHCWRDYLYIL